MGAGAPGPVGFGGGDLGREAAGLRPGSSAVVRAGVGAAVVPGAGLRQRLLTAPGGGALLEAVGSGIVLAAPGVGALLATREVGLCWWREWSASAGCELVSFLFYFFRVA